MDSRTIIFRVIFRKHPRYQWIWRSKGPRGRWVTRFEVEDCEFIRELLENPSETKINYYAGTLTPLIHVNHSIQAAEKNSPVAS